MVVGRSATYLEFMDPKATLETMLNHLGFTDATVTERTWEEHLLLDVTTEDSGRLIGRQGATLSDLQYLLNRMIHRGDDKTPRILLDVGGYRTAAREQLIKRAREAAEKVRHWGDMIELEPLGAFDRRIVHQALREDPDVETHSVELEDSDKKVIIVRPRRKVVPATAP